jgi:amino acid permease
MILDDVCTYFEHCVLCYNFVYVCVCSFFNCTLALHTHPFQSTEIALLDPAYFDNSTVDSIDLVRYEWYSDLQIQIDHDITFLNTQPTRADEGRKTIETRDDTRKKNLGVMEIQTEATREQVPPGIENGDACNENGGDEGEEVIPGERMGTTASARFNILSTMVGGGSLSLPMAFQKAGNGLLGPLLLLIVAAVTDYCFHILVNTARTLSPVSPNQTLPGKDSFESIASGAFGPKANIFSMGLVFSMCFFGTVGYAVLLRDMLMPITEVVFQITSPDPGPTMKNNIIMMTVVFLVTPLCTLKTLTALKRFGAASMFSVFILGSCIVYRSLECNLMGQADDDSHWWDAFQLWPDSWKDVLDAFPLFISCYVCHYNLLPVHNEFRGPSQERISWWLGSTVGYATLFYMVIGLAGSAYGRCTATGKVDHGNVLLEFPDDDPLLLVGRMCLAITITLAFPMLTIPARDILIRSLPKSWFKTEAYTIESSTTVETDNVTVSNSASQVQTDQEHDAMQSLREPLLENGTTLHDVPPQAAAAAAAEQEPEPASFRLRLVAVTFFFWTAALVACCVASIDVVWDLLGSSLSILLSHLIPCACYLVISGKVQAQVSSDSDDQGNRSSQSRRVLVSRVVAWLLIIVFTPLMFLSTGNAVYNTFSRD